MTSGVFSNRIARLIMVAAAAVSLPGCITIQAIEPVIDPPSQFKSDVTVPVEFAMPGTIGFRCAERGATFLGLPGINSGACADTELVTMLDPCMTVTAGAYAQSLCEGLKRYREESQTTVEAAQEARPAGGIVKASFSGSMVSAPAVKPQKHDLSEWDNVVVEFVASEDVEMRCAERGAKVIAYGGVMSCADRLMVTVANPCTADAQSWYTRTFCHEMAHANGWPADHPAHYQHLALKPASESPQAIALAAAQGATSANVYANLATLPKSPVLASAGQMGTPQELPAHARQFVENFVNAGIAYGAKKKAILDRQFGLAFWLIAPPRASGTVVPASLQYKPPSPLAAFITPDHGIYSPLPELRLGYSDEGSHAGRPVFGLHVAD